MAWSPLYSRSVGFLLKSSISEYPSITLKKVVKVVSNATGESSDGFHLLSLQQLSLQPLLFLFGLFSLSDITSQHAHVAGDMALGVMKGRGVDTVIDGGAVAPPPSHFYAIEGLTTAYPLSKP